MTLSSAIATYSCGKNKEFLLLAIKYVNDAIRTALTMEKEMVQ